MRNINFNLNLYFFRVVFYIICSCYVAKNLHPKLNFELLYYIVFFVLCFLGFIIYCLYYSIKLDKCNKTELVEDVYEGMSFCETFDEKNNRIQIFNNNNYVALCRELRKRKLDSKGNRILRAINAKCISYEIDNKKYICDMKKPFWLYIKTKDSFIYITSALMIMLVTFPIIFLFRGPEIFGFDSEITSFIGKCLFFIMFFLLFPMYFKVDIIREFGSLKNIDELLNSKDLYTVDTNLTDTTVECILDNTNTNVDFNL